MYMTVGLVAEQVRINDHNTWDVLGIMDALAFPSFPTRLPPVTLFLRFEAEPAGGGGLAVVV
jgi:hypothetical protein